MLKYPALIRELDPSDGGGYLVEIPDLPGCMADGETREEALRDAERAIDEWIDAARQQNRSVPSPGALSEFTRHWASWVPDHIYKKLNAQAAREGISLNALAARILEEGLGRREGAE